MDGTELLNQMKASGIECEIVCAFSDHRLRGTDTTTLHRTSADQVGEETQHTQITKARPRRSTYLFQQTIS